MNRSPSERNTTFQLKRALKAEDECRALQAKITEITKDIGIAWLLVDQHKDRLVELESTVERLRGELAQAEQVLREIAEHVSQYSDHTEDSFRRGLMALMEPTHKALKAAAIRFNAKSARRVKRVEIKRRPYSVSWIDGLEGDLEKENDMALSGYVTAEQRRCRQVITTRGLVVAYWYAPQDYEIFRNGVSLGRVKKFKHWYPEVQTPHATLGDGSRWPQKTRQAAIEWVVKHYKRQPSNAGDEPTP